MHRHAFIALTALALAFGGCEKKASDEGHQADNTKQNERDKNKSVTPFDQGNSQADLDTTQSIRKALMADDTLSQDAKNIKVVTNNGVVALRGAVKSDAERSTVDSIARRYAGANRVDNQVDVARPEGAQVH
jgi:hyperosmotically inducible protein